MKKISKINKLLAYIYMPVIFSIIAYLIIYIALKPYWDVAVSAVSLFTSKTEIQTASTERPPIYDPNAEPAEVKEAEKPYIDARDIDFPDSGEHYGQLICEKVGMDVPVYWDDTYEILRKGAGQYPGTLLPGYGRMILLSAHNVSHFHPLRDMEVGDVITFNTNYCKYEYEVTEIQVYNELELENWVIEHLNEDEEILVMYTCWPFEFQAGRKTDRLTVKAKRISGYDVKWRLYENE